MCLNCLLTAASEVYLFAFFTSPESLVKWSGIFQIHLLNQKTSGLNNLNQLTLEKRGHFWKFNNSRRIIKNTTGGPDTRDAHPDPNSFISMQFSAKMLPNNRLVYPLFGKHAPSPGKS